VQGAEVQGKGDKVDKGDKGREIRLINSKEN
jgi:hypothetical protein